MTKIFTADELYNFLYDGDYDSFAAKMDDLQLRLKYFEIGHYNWREDFYVLKFVDGKIVGVLDYCVCPKPTNQGNFHFISYISVDENYRWKGIAKELIDVFQKDLMRNDKGICGCSGFTADGYNFLRNKLLSVPNIECADYISF